LLVGLVVLGGAICAGTPSAQTRPNLSGKWQGTWAYKQATLGSGQVTMTLTQTGNKATGNMVVTGTPVDRSGAVNIMLSGNDVYLVYPTGFTGYLTISGRDEGRDRRYESRERGPEEAEVEASSKKPAASGREQVSAGTTLRGKVCSPKG
jgi:hypothetical protein